MTKRTHEYTTLTTHDNAGVKENLNSQEGGRKGHIPILYNHWVGKEQYQQHSFLDEPQQVKEQRRKQQPPERQLREAIERYVDTPTNSDSWQKG